jgi:CRP/FNR family transcriptional regulator
MEPLASTPIKIAEIRAACQNCSTRELCLPMGLGSGDVETLNKLIKRRRTLKKGACLYRVNEPLRALFAIRKGTLKTTGLMEDGRAQITGFHLPGELLGVDAINSDRHAVTAEALEPSDVCEIPLDELETLARKVPGLQHQLLRIMSREIVRDEQLLILLGRMNADERLASAIISFVRRRQRRGDSVDVFKLSMSRQDLGDYLGLALETVSRLFSKFQEEGLIEVQGRQLRLLDIGRLEAIAGQCLAQTTKRA